MAIPSNTDWELRTTGATTNGGGFFDNNPGTSVDYSQQDAAQLALTDIATDGSGTGISSVTGGFTAAMEGNCIYLAGSGVATGWYMISGYTDTNNVTIERSAGASATGITGNVGGAWLPNDTDSAIFFSGTNKGNYNYIYWKTGTYTFTALVTASHGYGRWVGYKTTRGDVPIGDDRPFIDFGTGAGYVNWTASYGRTNNLRMINSNVTVSPSQTMYSSGAAHQQYNCKIERIGGGANNYGMRFNSDYGFAVQCEYRSSLGIGLLFADADFTASYCYIHDSYRGASYTSSGARGANFIGCIFSNIGDYALNLYYASKAVGCTFYDVTGTGLNGASIPVVAVNNIFHTCGTAFSGPEGNTSDNNVYYNNTADFAVGVVAGERDLFTDPMMVDPANEDFTLAASSPCFRTGFSLGTQVGLP